MVMRIAIVGAGNVGGALARGWSDAGHDIYLGVRDPKAPKYQSLVKDLGAQARLGSVPQAVAESEAVLLAVPWPAAQDAVKAAGELRGRMVLDCTNPLKMEGTRMALALGFSTSGAEQVAFWARGASVFKIFNHVGANVMARPDFPGGKPLMCVCGDDENRKPTVLRLAEDLGFEAVDAGKLSVARLLEPLAALWIQLALVQGLGRNIAFSLLRG
jgi:hypothetical protein